MGDTASAVTFEQLGRGVVVALQCPCGECGPLRWRVVQMRIGAAVFQSLKDPRVLFHGTRREDGGITDGIGSRLRMTVGRRVLVG